MVEQKIKNSLSQDLAVAEYQSTKLIRLSQGMSNASVSRNELITILQATVQGDDKNNTYISIFDWSGKIIVHPSITKVDTQADYYKADAQEMFSPKTVNQLYKTLNEKDEEGQVIAINPIVGTDWIITTHINTSAYRLVRADAYKQYMLVFVILLLVLLICIFLILRFLTKKYDLRIEEIRLELMDGVVNLSKLNESLEKYKESLVNVDDSQKGNNDKVDDNPENKNDRSKTRILTYLRNELLPIAVEDLAYVYVENTITYFIRKDGKRSTSNESLDQVYSSLDERLFYKANRQFIIAISAIKTISKFRNSQLKIQVSPDSDIDIIIGKNKAASFKKWLDI